VEDGELLVEGPISFGSEWFQKRLSNG